MSGNLRVLIGFHPEANEFMVEATKPGHSVGTSDLSGLAISSRFETPPLFMRAKIGLPGVRLRYWGSTLHFGETFGDFPFISTMAWAEAAPLTAERAPPGYATQPYRVAKLENRVDVGVNSWVSAGGGNFGYGHVPHSMSYGLIQEVHKDRLVTFLADGLLHNMHTVKTVSALIYV